MKYAHDISGHHYDGRYDDGTTKNVPFVEVEGFPGTYPNGQLWASVANNVTDMKALVQEQFDKEFDGDSTWRMNELIVRTVNDRGRIIDLEVAHQAAHYQDAIRVALPAARAALQGAYESYAAFEDVHGSSRDFMPEGTHLPIVGDMLDTQTAYEGNLGPELAETWHTVAGEYSQANTRVLGMVSALRDRVWQAETDYRSGIDRTTEIRAADAAQFAVE